MNRSTVIRSEEARRQAQAAIQKARQQQDELLRDRAMMFASETRKVENLRALRLAKMESAKLANGQPDTADAKRRVRA